MLHTPSHRSRICRWGLIAFMQDYDVRTRTWRLCSLSCKRANVSFRSPFASTPPTPSHSLVLRLSPMSLLQKKEWGWKSERENCSSTSPGCRYVLQARNVYFNAVSQVQPASFPFFISDIYPLPLTLFLSRSLSYPHRLFEESRLLSHLRANISN